jgi:hypothetical protein
MAGLTLPLKLSGVEPQATCHEEMHIEMMIMILLEHQQLGDWSVHSEGRVDQKLFFRERSGSLSQGVLCENEI